MTTKKNTRRGAGDKRRDSAAAEIAAHLAAVLAHPDTPVGIYNAITDALSDLSAPAGFWDSREYIEILRRAEDERASEEGGEA